MKKNQTLITSTLILWIVLLPFAYFTFTKNMIVLIILAILIPIALYFVLNIQTQQADQVATNFLKYNSDEKVLYSEVGETYGKSGQLGVLLLTENALHFITDYGSVHSDLIVNYSDIVNYEIKKDVMIETYEDEFKFKVLKSGQIKSILDDKVSH